jgi:acetolactate decarboxylase
MPTLTCPISETLMNALRARARATGEPVDHLVMRALADMLAVEHATLYQVSTSGALVEGISQGVVTVGELLQHGDFGLGTFADLDGEMVAFDGRVWRVPGAGIVREAAAADLVPFDVVTAFRPERRVEVDGVASMATLLERLDGLRNSNNLFFAVRLDGRARRVRTRAVCKHPNARLVDVAAEQVEFDLHDVDGTFVGFWTPAYARTVNVAGWHLHFLSDDRASGGHVLDVDAARLTAQVQHLDDFRMAIPESPEFLRADLSGDPTAALDRAER